VTGSLSPPPGASPSPAAHAQRPRAFPTDVAGILAAQMIDRPKADHTALRPRRPTALAPAQGSIIKSVPEVLFVCVHNAGRSQMAAALLDRHAGGRVRVRSAGSQPASELNPHVITALAEIGLDVSHEFPKPLTDDVTRAADIVITMGCGDACPIYPGKRYLDWDLPDPAGQPLEVVRTIRDDIDVRVRRLLSELPPPSGS
jgi:arsenate reductase